MSTTITAASRFTQEEELEFEFWLLEQKEATRDFILDFLDDQDDMRS